MNDVGSPSFMPQRTRPSGLLGFILDKAQWPDRYRSGDLVSSALDWRAARACVRSGAAPSWSGSMISKLPIAAGRTWAVPSHPHPCA